MTIETLKAEIREFVALACDDALAALPGDQNRDARMAAVMQVVASLYKGEQREVAAVVVAEETRIDPPHYLVFSRDFVRGDKLAVR